MAEMNSIGLDNAYRDDILRSIVGQDYSSGGPRMVREGLRPAAPRAPEFSGFESDRGARGAVMDPMVAGGIPRSLQMRTPEAGLGVSRDDFVARSPAGREQEGLSRPDMDPMVTGGIPQPGLAAETALDRHHPAFQGRPIQPGVSAPPSPSQMDMLQTGQANRDALSGIGGAVSGFVGTPATTDASMTPAELALRAQLESRAQTTGQPLAGPPPMPPTGAASAAAVPAPPAAMSPPPPRPTGAPGTMAQAPSVQALPGGQAGRPTPPIMGSTGGTGAGGGGGGQAGVMPPTQVDPRSPEAYDPETGVRDPVSRAASVFERMFGEEGSDRRANMSRALMMAGAAIMGASHQGIGPALGAGIQAGVLTFDQAQQALVEEEREARELGMREEAHEISMELARLRLERARAGGGAGAIGRRAATSAVALAQADAIELMSVFGMEEAEANARALRHRRFGLTGTDVPDEDPLGL